MAGKLLCRLGWHRWKFHSYWAGRCFLTAARCSRPGCCEGDWSVVDEECP